MLEPKDKGWQTEGSEWIGSRVRRIHGVTVADGIITRWRPRTTSPAAQSSGSGGGDGSADDVTSRQALWHMARDDEPLTGPGEDLSAFELREALKNSRHKVAWRTSGHAWIGQRVRRFLVAGSGDGGGDTGSASMTVVSDAIITHWLPACAAEPALWHVHPDDGDAEDIEGWEVIEGLRAMAAGARRPST